MEIFFDEYGRRLLYGLVFASLLFSWSYAQSDNLDSPKKVEAYLKKQISENSQDVAVAVYTVNTDGTLRMDDALTYNIDKPMPLASTVKIVVLAAYAQAVVEGKVDPDEEVSVRDWEVYYLPGTDGGAHAGALEELNVSSDELGFAKDVSTVRLDDIVSAMIVQSDNAATDYVMNRVGDEAMARVIQENSLTQQEVPLSFLGTFLALNNAETPLPYSDLQRSAERDEQRYLTDSAWHEVQQNSPLASLDTFEKQAEVLQSSTKGSAENYARMMGGVVTETFISPEVSRVMRKHLEWPMQIPGNEESFETFGAKGGSLPGILTEASYLIPKTGDFAGEARVAVLFFNRLPEASFNSLAQSYAQQSVLLRLATERSAVDKMRAGE